MTRAIDLVAMIKRPVIKKPVAQVRYQALAAETSVLPSVPSHTCAFQKDQPKSITRVI
jgi:hypothetical protein